MSQVPKSSNIRGKYKVNINFDQNQGNEVIKRVGQKSKQNKATATRIDQTKFLHQVG